MNCKKRLEKKKEKSCILNFFLTAFGIVAACITVVAILPKLHDKLVNFFLNFPEKKKEVDCFDFEPRVISKEESENYQEDNYNGI